MRSAVALILCLAFVVLALILDTRRSPRVSAAIWIPLLWLCILASRPLDVWFSNFGRLGVGTEDGSALHQLVLGLLMLLAILVLRTRKPVWRDWAKANAWIVAFFCYCLLSIAWSDFPGIALRRWIRAIGALLMILVVVTDDDPQEAVATVVRRAGLILLPFSVLLIKYYRDLGVTYDYWTGELQICGVATDKNALGRLAMLWGLFAVWEYLRAVRSTYTFESILRAGTQVVVFLVAMWLLHVARSSTSLVCFVIGTATLLVVGLPIVARRSRYLGTLLVVAAAIGIGLNASLDLSDVVLSWLGKDSTLTMRTFIWQDLLRHVANPVIGVGYDSFWLGSRLEYFISNYRVTSAHNGYLDIYLELGIIGIALYALVLRGIFVNAKSQIVTGDRYGRLCIAMLLVFLAYNVTEAAWRLTHLSFFVMLLVGVRVPQLARLAESTEPSVDVPSSRGLLRPRAKPADAPSLGRASNTRRLVRPIPRRRS